MTSPTSERERLRPQVATAFKFLDIGDLFNLTEEQIQAKKEDAMIDLIIAEQRSLLDKVEAANGWCSVNDVMPNEGDYVVGRLEWPSGKEVYAVLQLKTIEDNAPWLYEDGELIFSVNVTHWTPLAQLRKEIG